MYTESFAQTLAIKNIFRHFRKNFSRDYSLHTQSPTQMNPLSWTLCSTLTCHFHQTFPSKVGSNNCKGYIKVVSQGIRTIFFAFSEKGDVLFHSPRLLEVCHVFLFSCFHGPAMPRNVPRLTHDNRTMLGQPNQCKNSAWRRASLAAKMEKLKSCFLSLSKSTFFWHWRMRIGNGEMVGMLFDHEISPLFPASWSPQLFPPPSRKGKASRLWPKPPMARGKHSQIRSHSFPPTPNKKTSLNFGGNDFWWILPRWIRPVMNLWLLFDLISPIQKGKNASHLTLTPGFFCENPKPPKLPSHLGETFQVISEITMELFDAVPMGLGVLVEGQRVGWK